MPASWNRISPRCRSEIVYTLHMMSDIEYRVGDATLPGGEGPRVLVHVCNDRGGWGRGFVVALSRRYPEPEREYRRWYAGRANNDFALGAVQFVAVGEGLWVANLVGQAGYRTVDGVPPVRYDAIEWGLAAGTWDRIESLVASTLGAAGVSVTVYDLP